MSLGGGVAMNRSEGGSAVRSKKQTYRLKHRGIGDRDQVRVGPAQIDVPGRVSAKTQEHRRTIRVQTRVLNVDDRSEGFANVSISGLTIANGYFDSSSQPPPCRCGECGSPSLSLC